MTATISRAALVRQLERAAPGCGLSSHVAESAPEALTKDVLEAQVQSYQALHPQLSPLESAALQRVYSVLGANSIFGREPSPVAEVADVAGPRKKTAPHGVPAFSALGAPRIASGEAAAPGKPWTRELPEPLRGSIILSPDGETLYAKGHTGTLFALNRADGEVLWSLPAGTADMGTTPAVAPDGKTLFAVAHERDKIVFYAVDTAAHAVRWSQVLAEGWDWDQERQLVSPVVSPDGGTVYVANNAGRVSAFDTANGEKRWEYQGERKGNHPRTPLALSPDGSQLFAATGPTRLTAFDTRRGEVLWDAEVDGFTSGAGVVSPDGSRLYFPLSKGLGLFNTENGRFGWSVWESQPTGNIQQSPLVGSDGETVLLPHKQGHVLILDGATGLLRKVATKKDETFTAAAFGADGKTAIAMNHRARFYEVDVEDGSLRQLPSPYVSPRIGVETFTLSPDGAFVYFSPPEEGKGRIICLSLEG